MDGSDGFEGKVAFVWSVADLLRGDYRPAEYRQVMLPLLVLRRLDAVLEPTKQQVLDAAARLEGRTANPDLLLKRAAGQGFYNTSELTFGRLLESPNTIAASLRAYVHAFSPGAVEVLERYRFDETVSRLDQAGLLYVVLGKFAELDLHPDRVPNHTMGLIFEELLRRFSELSNETAGEHFTPREVIRLMVGILFSGDTGALTGRAPVRSLYDPACGTGGMLNISEQYLTRLNPQSRLEMFGQELNPETWAIARSDLLIQGQDPERIVLGNSLVDDGHAGTRFDYLLANPPFGVDWGKYRKPIEDEHEQLGDDGRYGPGTPRVSDGSMLFLLHMISKMKPAADGGSRLAIVFSGSPLFSGGAGSGESEIRRWVLEQDLLEGIVALPDRLFYNTGISTYFWVLSNRKSPDRAGKVVLLDARGEFAKMRKSLGDKRKEFTAAQIDDITRLYDEALALEGHDQRIRVCATTDFGYQRITVERPMRRRWELTADAVAEVEASKHYATLPVGERASLSATLAQLTGESHATEAAFARRLVVAVPGLLPPPLKRAVIGAAAVADPDADVVLGRDGQPQPDPDLRDHENVPLGEDVDAYVAREVLPHVPDARIDHDKTRIGYEIPLTRYFYEYVPPRPLAEIDAELDALQVEIAEVLGRLRR